MMSCALRICITAATLLLLWAAPNPALAEINSARAHGPNAGVALVELAEGVGAEVLGTELIDALKEGSEHFRNAKFDVAVDWYELAERLAPERTNLRSEIRAMVRVASEKRFLQAETLKQLPTAQSELESRYKATYTQARDFYKRQDFENAYKMFHDLWLVSGDFKGTLDYIRKSQEKGNLPMVALSDVNPDGPGLVQTAAAPPTTSTSDVPPPAPSAVQVGEVPEASRAEASAPAADEVQFTVPTLEAGSDASPSEVALVPPPPPAPTPVDETPALLEKARTALADGRLDEADSTFAQVLSLDPDNADAKSGIRNLETARADRAKQDLARTIEMAVSQGESFLEAGRLDSAQSAFETALTLDPGNQRALAGIGRLQPSQQSRRAETYANPVTENPTSRQEEIYVAQVDDPGVVEAPDEDVPAEAVPAEQSTDSDILNVVTDPEMSTEEAPAATAAPAAREVQEVAAPAPVAEPQPAAEKRGWFSRLFGGDDDTAAATTNMAATTAAPVATVAQASTSSGNPQIDTILQDARYQYEVERNLEAARQKWQWVLEIDPANKVAQTYLTETESEYQEYLATKERQERSAESRRAQDELLRSPLTIQTDRPTALSEFMRLISFSTAEEIEYYIADGAETPVFVNFVDRPLSEVLDAVLVPVGLTWKIDENNLITIETDLRHNAFRLTEAQVSQVRSLLQSGRMQTAIWGQPEPPSKGIEMTLDERQRVLLVVGSRLHLQKVTDLVSSLDSAERPTLDTAFYKIREQDGPKIKSLINAVVTADQGSPFEMDRRIFIDGTDLIIRDTPENLTKIEELLLDQNFIQKMRDENLEITNFNLAPKDFETTPRDVIDTFTSRIVITIKTLLYAKTGEEAAAAQGRRLFFDNATYQLTIIDTPTNLARVGNYLNSLPELSRKRQQQVIFLEHAVAESLASDLVSILGLRGALGGAESGETVVKRLNRGDEFTFRDLRIRVVRIEENNEDDREDDSVELNIITGTNSSSITLRELDTTFFENYELTAEDVQATGNEDRPGEGVVRLLVRYVGSEEEREQLAEEEIQAEEEISEEEGVSIFPFGPLNALIIRYDNPAVLQDIQDLIVQLDLPTPQVEVETKFVQVNEQRAREFSADFGLENLVNGGDLNTDLFNFNSGFGRPQDEFRNTGDIPLENPWAANLLNGTTVLDFILGSGVPGLSFQLRMLEAEGVLNIVNGPKVTMLDNEQGEFRIERGSPYPDNLPAFDFEEAVPRRSPSGSIGGPISDPDVDESFFDVTGEALANDDAGVLQDAIQAVVLLVTPQVTSEKSIIFEITAELLDLDNFLGGQIFAGSPPFENDNIPLIQDDRLALIEEQRRILQAHAELAEMLGQETDLDETAIEALIGLGTDAVSNINDIIQSLNPFDATAQAPFQNFQQRTRNNRLGQVAMGGLVTTGAMLRTRKLIVTRARTSDGGTIVLGGWTGERTIESTSGVPVLRNMPYIGKLFTRNARSSDRTTLLIFLTAHLID